jgi:NRPS condensation-like uncharacterized protein
MTEPAEKSQNLGIRGPVFVSNHALVARIHGDFSIPELDQALDGIRSRHTTLIPGADSEDPLAAHFLVRERTGCGESDWQKTVKEELLSHFPQGQGPFARFIVLRLEGAQTDLVGVFHHGICDGMSGVYVMRDLLQLLGEPGLILAPIPRQSNTRDLIPAAVRKNRFVRLKIKGIVAAIRLMVWFRQMRARWLPSTGQNPTLASPANQHMCILTQTLTVEQTAALVARCKAEQASVHAALSVAWLRARAIQLEKRKSWVRSASSPISLRERLGIPDTSGLYLANATIKVNCAPRRDFWNAAREFKKKLNQASRDENLFLVPMIIGAVFSQLPEKDRKDVVPILFNRPVNYDFSITNLGRIDLPVKVGRFELEAFYNLVNASEHERTVCVNTFKGRLTTCLLFRESKMDLGSAEKLEELVSQQLAQAVHGRLT